MCALVREGEQDGDTEREREIERGGRVGARESEG